MNTKKIVGIILDEMLFEEHKVRVETQEHIANVGNFIDLSSNELLSRKDLHDKTKLEDFEFNTFLEYTPKLKNSTYGSDEYNTFLKEMKPALDHHYANNRHHPEHFDNGMNGMNLIDLIEMLCDWKAATMRHDDGDIIKSLELNKKRFEISDQLFAILENTVRDLKFN